MKKKLLCMLSALSMVAVSGAITASADCSVDPETGTMTWNFMELVKDGVDTNYGPDTDNTRTIGDYVTANLTYDGTYVSSDGKVYLKSKTVCNKDSAYKDGSYIAFTAPADGMLSYTGVATALFDGETYTSKYNKDSESTVDYGVKAGVTYYLGYRKNDTDKGIYTYVNGIVFTPSVTKADEYEAEGYDDKGYTVTLNGAGTVNWYAWNEDKFAKIDVDGETTISGGVDIVVGLIVEGGVDGLGNINFGAALTAAETE